MGLFKGDPMGQASIANAMEERRPHHLPKLDHQSVHFLEHVTRELLAHQDLLTMGGAVISESEAAKLGRAAAGAAIEALCKLDEFVDELPDPNEAKE